MMKNVLIAQATTLLIGMGIYSCTIDATMGPFIGGFLVLSVGAFVGAMHAKE